MIHIDLPASEKDIRKLKAGDEVGLYGLVVTARDAAHEVMIKGKADFVKKLIKNGAIYHCGPVMKQTGSTWNVIAAGPTTSIREEPYEATVMKKYGIRVVIGKGGMGADTLKACSDLGAVYVHAIGGAAVSLAQSIKNVREVHMLSELGVPEAFWVFEVENFKGVVTMDSKGTSLHEKILKDSSVKRKKLVK